MKMVITKDQEKDHFGSFKNEDYLSLSSLPVLIVLIAADLFLLVYVTALFFDKFWLSGGCLFLMVLFLTGLIIFGLRQYIFCWRKKKKSKAAYLLLEEEEKQVKRGR